MSEEWTEVAEEGELEEGVPIRVKVGKASVLLVRLADGIHACGGTCSHYGAPLHQGVLLGRIITCPWHTARFDVTSGRVEAPPALDHRDRYPVKVEDGKVFVGPSEEHGPPAIEGDDRRTFVIVGGGAAGNSAAQALREEGFAGRVVVVTREADRPYDRPSLSKEYMSGEAPRKWLPLHPASFYDDRGIEFMTERNAVGIDPGARKLALADGDEIEFDAALLATGGVPRPLSIPGSDLRNCFLLRSLADGDAIVSALEDAQKAVVLGAGFIGMEAAAAMAERGLQVHVVAPEDVPMAGVFGREIGAWLRGRHEEHGVAFHLGTLATGIKGAGAVESVVLADGSTLEADVVVAGLGIRPAVDFLEGSGLVEDGAVPVDGTLRTGAEGIYAAGDIARVPDPTGEESFRIEHWIVAERQGQHAARAMLGSDAPYREVPFFWTLQFGASLKFVGYPVEPDETAVRGSIQDGDFLAGYYRQGRLRAVAGLGRPKEVIAAAELLKAGRNVSPAALADERTDVLGMLSDL